VVNALAQLDPQILVLELRPMQAVVARDAAGGRFSLLLIGVFAGASTLLTVIGLYSVLATTVRDRTGEIAVRAALGATPASIARLVLVEGLLLMTTGLGMGLTIAIAATRLMTSMLVGVRPTDRSTFVLVGLSFMMIAAIACWVPARRAASLDPAAALRGQE